MTKVTKVKGRKLDYTSAVKTLKKKRDCLLDEQKRIIYLLSGRDKRNPRKNDLGNKSYGKIDYLCKHQAYSIVEVDDFREIKK